MAERELDVVVFGATSVTGRRVAAYLSDRAAETGASWAAAARDAEKLRAVLAAEGAQAPATLTADVEDQESLAELAARARVVLNLVGPYTLHGRPVIAACEAGGAHYVDLTGEIPFVRRMIAEFDHPARDAGVKVVQVCGFEALPPDIGVALARKAARERWDEELVEGRADRHPAAPTRRHPALHRLHLGRHIAEPGRRGRRPRRPVRHRSRLPRARSRARRSGARAEPDRGLPGGRRRGRRRRRRDATPHLGSAQSCAPIVGSGAPTRSACRLALADGIEARVAGERFAEVGIEAAGHPGYLATARLMAEAGPSASAQPAFASTSRTRGTRVLAR